ncbi:MAG: carbohydrate ABC transporter permease [Erysipelotrichaceae bacterium]|nr:carbohydrate ABC transporter permease [Erysipelotrichaceae bacterium]
MDKIKELERKSRARNTAWTVAVFALLVLWAVIVLFPFYWMLLTSVKSYASYNAEYVPKFFTLSPTIENYVQAFTAVPLAKYFVNTIIFTVVTTGLMLIIVVLSAFAFSRLEFKGKNLVFTLFLSLMMIPNELVIITNFVTITNAGLRNSFAGLILPSVTSVFYIYLLKENFEQIPDELYKAAKVDGTSDFKYLWKVMIPLSLPTLISITILKMMGAWNSYIWPRLVANDEAHAMITNGLRNAFTDTSGDVNYPVQMAAVALVSAPLFLVFIFLRKYIMSGVSRSGIKG